MTTSNADPKASRSDDRAGNGAQPPVSEQPEPQEFEQEIKDVRAEMSVLIRELDRRRHEATDVKVQVRRHPLAVGVVAAAGLLAIGFVVLGTYRALRPDTPTQRARKLARSLAIASRDPDRLLQALERRPDPAASLLSMLVGAGGRLASHALAPTGDAEAARG